MSRRVLSTVWNNFASNLRRSLGARKEEGTFVGADEDGNRYYEKAASEKMRKARRWFVTKGGIDLMDTLDTAPGVAHEWEAWLRGSREVPPTQEEIEKTRKIALKTAARVKILNKQEDLAKQESNKSLTPKEFHKPSMPQAKQSTTNFPVYEDLQINPRKGPPH